MTPVVVLRPEPGNRRTAAALRALGMDVRQMPLFAVVPVDWTSPDPARRSRVPRGISPALFADEKEWSLSWT